MICYVFTRCEPMSQMDQRRYDLVAVSYLSTDECEQMEDDDPTERTLWTDPEYLWL